jgi:transcriptional regulator with XRE-family HTH domain
MAPETPRLDFGTTIREMRKRVGLTGTALAKLAKTSKSYIHDIEVGRRRPDEGFTRRLAKVLGYQDADYLVLLSGRVPQGMDVMQLKRGRNGKNIQGATKGARNR